MNKLIATLTAYRLWIAGAAAAVIGYTAYRSVATQRATPVALSGASGAEALAASAAGGDLALRGVALGLGPTEAAIGLGQVALGVTGGAVGDLSGLAGLLGGVLGGVTETLITNPPAVSPPPPAPAPTPTPPPPAPAPTPTPPPPAPAPTPTETFLRYDVNITGPGQLALYIVGTDGNLSLRMGYFSAASSAPVTREVTAGRLHWRTAAGGYTGWSYVPGASTPLSLWVILKVWRRADGSLRYEAISQSGS
jgi:hypothetical protein